MNVAVIGTGYVGLVAGACFSESGNDVICVDINEDKIAGLNRGEIPIFEPGLKELVLNNSEAGRLNFTTDLKSAVEASEIIFIAVGTPQDEDGSADLKYVLQVAASIGKFMNGPKIIVDKSTVPVGTATKVTEEVSKHTDHEFEVVSNPEFLKEGAAIDDFMKPDRVVVGVSSERSEKAMKELYAPFVRTNNPIIVMDVRSAEMTKYAANALLATKISFMNEVSLLCDAVGADVNSVRLGIGSDVRIGPHFLFPGVGYGGSCFPKDIRALGGTGREHGVELEIVKAVDKVNERQKKVLFDKIVSHYGSEEALAGKKIAIWGLSFKPKTDDMREAPSITVIRSLAKAGVTMTLYDPEAMSAAKKIFADLEGVSFAESSYDALDGADALAIVTEWNEFRRPNFDKIGETLSSKTIFDGRNLFQPEVMKDRGFTYYSIGRPSVS